MATNAISDMLRQKESPTRSRRKVVQKGSVALLKESIQLGCVSQDSYPRKSIPREPGTLGSKHAVKFSKGTWHQIKIRERKGPSRGIIPECAPPCAPKFEDLSHEDTLIQERCPRKAAWDLAKHTHNLKNSDKTMFEISGEKGMLPPTSKRLDEREFVVDSGAPMHMMSKKELTSEEKPDSSVDCSR